MSPGVLGTFFQGDSNMLVGKSAFLEFSDANEVEHRSEKSVGNGFALESR
jgi:hypothetical protein